MPKKRVYHDLDFKQKEMKRRNLLAKKRADEFFGRSIPKGLCPLCYLEHSSAVGGVPAECFRKALQGDVSTVTEFERYLKKNKLGKIV